MSDPRVAKLAQVLVQYSLAIKPGETLLVRTTPLAEELSLEVYQQAIAAGAHVHMQVSLQGMDEIFFKHANDAQIDYIPPVQKMIVEQFDASLTIDAPYNSRSMAGVDPARLSRRHRALSGLTQTWQDRAARQELKWCLTVFPTNAGAQDANMSLRQYQDFVFGAGLLDEADPVAAWQKEGERQNELIAWLAGKEEVVIRGSDIDLRMNIKGRPFINADGRYNFPDGEIFTGPVEDSVNGWVKFRYPVIYGGREVTDVELQFEDGKVVKEGARNGVDLLTAQLNTDEGARYLGEWGIGTNYGIQRFSKHMLFDEKMGGTIHLAVGSGYPESGSKNKSGIHWDMLCDMADSEIIIDGELFYKNGKFVL